MEKYRVQSALEESALADRFVNHCHAIVAISLVSVLAFFFGVVVHEIRYSSADCTVAGVVWAIT
ncbi:MAG: hypothetical protein HRT77_10095 [Halioglobus sp.]|nr:hypothetical protein [Halioglobus sp.]